MDRTVFVRYPGKSIRVTDAIAIRDKSAKELRGGLFQCVACDAHVRVHGGHDGADGPNDIDHAEHAPGEGGDCEGAPGITEAALLPRIRP